VFYSVLDAKGLYTYANPLGQQSPPGSMSVALNVNCDQIGVTTTRRGFDFYSANKPFSSGTVTKLFSYENTLYAASSLGQFARDTGAGVWSVYGSGFTMQAPSGGFLHQMLAGGNSYFTTSNGIYKLSGVNATAPIPAGAPQALDTVTVVSGTIASGFLNAQSQCAYQVVWGYTDDSNLQIVGAPSSAAFAANTQAAGAGNNSNVTLTISMPPFVRQNSTLPWFYQIYRTPNTGSLSVPPGNNYQMVAQLNPSAGDYTNGFVSYSDTVLDSLLGAFLYTASGQPDVGNPYEQPPLALDAAYFNSMAFYANFTTRQAVLVTLDAVGPASGIQSGDTFTLTDSTSGTAYTYTGGAANNSATRVFKVDTGGTPAANIQATAQNLVSVINQDPNNTLFYAQYTSGYSGLPGQISLAAQNLSQSAFYVTSSRTTCWTPTVPSSGASYASSATTVTNQLQVSQVSKPESCPPSFIIPVGSPNYSIARIIPVRTALIVVKPEEGVFQITGSTPTTLTVTTLDTTAYINGSETMAPLNNAGYFFTTQGVMLVNESGCEIMSRNVQGDILALSSSQYTNFESLAFAVGYQSDNAYILFLQANPQDTYSTLQYRYNWITQAWTTWDLQVTAAVVNPADDRLYLATPDGYVLRERKTYTNTDYADVTRTVTINSIGTNQFTLASALNVNVGDEISQINGGTNYTCSVTAVNPITGVVSVSTTSGFVTGTASDTNAINSIVTFTPTNCGYPAFIKKFTTWSFEFTSIGFTTATAAFTTDFYPTQESVTLMPKFADTWGTFPWGTVQWGVTTAVPQAISTYSTKNTAIGHWVELTISMQQAYTGFAFAGYGVFFNFLGDRFR
jgi:hypothetical protein